MEPELSYAFGKGIEVASIAKISVENAVQPKNNNVKLAKAIQSVDKKWCDSDLKALMSLGGDAKQKRLILGGALQNLFENKPLGTPLGYTEPNEKRAQQEEEAIYRVLITPQNANKVANKLGIENSELEAFVRPPWHCEHEVDSLPKPPAHHLLRHREWQL